MSPLKKDLIVFKGLELYANSGNPHALGVLKLFTNATNNDFGDRLHISEIHAPYKPSIDRRISHLLQQRNHSTLKQLNVSYSSHIRQVTDMTSFPGYSQISMPEYDVEKLYAMVMNKISKLCSSSENLTANQLNYLKARKSVLDVNIEYISDAKRNLKLSPLESNKLESYLAELRLLEKEIANSMVVKPARECPDFSRNSNVSGDRKLKLMFDLMKLALEWDVANVVSFQFGGAEDKEIYSDISSSDSHSLTHKKSSDYEKICRYQWENISYFLSKLKEIKYEDNKKLSGYEFSFNIWRRSK